MSAPRSGLPPVPLVHAQVAGQVARFVWLLRNARLEQKRMDYALRDERAADEVSRAKDDSMGFPGIHG